MNPSSSRSCWVVAALALLAFSASCGNDRQQAPTPNGTGGTGDGGSAGNGQVTIPPAVVPGPCIPWHVPREQLVERNNSAAGGLVFDGQLYWIRQEAGPRGPDGELLEPHKRMLERMRLPDGPMELLLEFEEGSPGWNLVNAERRVCWLESRNNSIRVIRCWSEEAGDEIVADDAYSPTFGGGSHYLIFNREDGANVLDLYTRQLEVIEEDRVPSPRSSSSLPLAT